MVEAAISLPLVMLLIFSVFWAGLTFRTYLTVDHSASAAARAASVAGNSADADYKILQEIKSDGAAFAKSSLQRVIVYPATGFESGPSAQCLSASLGCNTYTAADLNEPTTAFGVGGTFTKDDNWSSSTRDVSRSSSELLGVYVEAKAGAGGIGLPKAVNLKKFKVVRLEPKSF